MGAYFLRAVEGVQLGALSTRNRDGTVLEMYQWPLIR
ncbi:hypothetical protein SAMN05444921_12320 [Streptomyces wuyuanensis]|uniref:Uncharacterized protein n=1 Tax=Streptomyces wuyuanensis TaxID=1196353 RepID=A0A1G9ZZX7_9ACTN|nr:hypothetical protein SAMN05444921_12320 [Streptomyces wuyuanensis]